MVAIQFNKTQNFFQVHQYFSIYRWYLFFFKQNLNISHEYLIQHSFKWVKYLVLPHFKWVKYLVLPHFKWVKYLVLPHFDRPVNLTGTRQLSHSQILSQHHSDEGKANIIFFSQHWFVHGCHVKRQKWWMSYSVRSPKRFKTCLELHWQH